MSPKIIYDEELACLKGDGKDVELLKRLPTYDSLKSTMYKVKNKSAKIAAATASVEESADYFSDASEDEKVRTEVS